MNDYVVYCHVSPSGKKYVGISNNPVKRWRNGLGYEKNYRFMRAISKYGLDSFEHNIIAASLSAEEAAEMERRLIEEWNLTDFSCGYNLRAGGDGPFSEESKSKMSECRRGNKNSVGRVLPDDVREKISKSLIKYYKERPGTMTGKHLSPEQIEKLRRRVFSEETKEKMRKNHADVSGAKNQSARPVRQLTKSGEVVAEYPYATLAAKKYGLDLSSIIKCCRGKQKMCGGFQWEYIKAPGVYGWEEVTE